MSIRPIAVCLLLVNALGVHCRYWNQLQIARRPGLRGAVEYVLANRPGGEPVIVVHPAIYHSARYHARGVADPRLVLSSELSHYNGGAILIPADTIAPAELQKMGRDTVWVLDTTGFGGVFARSRLPASWQPVVGSHAEFPEVYYFQREVTATLYKKVPEASVRE